ncbi:hypothetical protein HPB52_018098 [Rhipicephalus sanguineus]|uniref:THAP-type domain-containing protein n=1 Tax=Rhipicephalus sanguineus TaxID=34632 RepID=A0A9D4Q2I8_RHISA|nr:hypothetical protein HPB52_018098 [Rhipicephalus sanguineus]
MRRMNVDGSTWTPTANSRVCSEHFISGTLSVNFTGGKEPLLAQSTGFGIYHLWAKITKPPSDGSRDSRKNWDPAEEPREPNGSSSSRPPAAKDSRDHYSSTGRSRHRRRHW